MLMMMIFGSSRSEKPRFAWTFIIVFILFHGGPRVNGQAFTYSRITLSRPLSAVGATLQASCNATYLASTTFVMDWRINDTVVALYQINNNMVPQLANGTHHYDVVFSTVTTTVHTGDTFKVILKIRNLNLNDDQTAISVTCTNCVQVRTLIKVEECQTDNSNGVIASDVVSPCGLGCQVQYSCESGYEGHNITATCLADATFDATPSCVQSNIDSNSTLIILPTNQATIATKVTGLIINSGDILSPNICAWTYKPGLTIGSQFYQSLFGGCKSTTTATYSISCFESSGVVSSNLTFLTPLTSNVSVMMKCSPSPTYNVQVIVKDCTSPTPSNVPVNPPTGVYNTPAHFQCSQNSTLFYSSGTIGNTATKCLASAEWKNEKIVQCWSAPTATLIGNNTHCVGDKATFQCKAVGGFPLADKVEVYFNDQIQALNGNTWTSTALSSSNNGDIVECRAISMYTKIAEYSHLGRDKKTLTVYYPAKNPKIENKMSDLLIKADDGYLLRSDGTLTMNCSADGNPAVNCSWSCSSCVGLSDTCGVTNVGVRSSTDITCVVGNGVCGGSNVIINQRITLVYKSRIPNLSVDGSPTTASVITRNKTQSLSLGCGIESETGIKTTFLWVKDGEVKSGSNNFMINNLTSLDTGLYSCNTTDAFGNFASTIYIDVIYGAESFTVDGDPNSNGCIWYIATPGPQSCNISFSLNPATYTTNLTKNGAIVVNDANQMQTSPPSFVFLRNKPTYSDSGVYTLRITNDKFQVDFIFNISVINMIAPTEQPITNPPYISPTNNPITNPPYIPPPNNWGVIIGAACGGVVLLILIVVLVYYFLGKQTNKTKGTGNAQLATSHVCQEPVGSVDEGYAEINHPQQSAYQNIGQNSTVEPSTSIYENFRNNVSVVRDNAGYVNFNALDPNLEAGTGCDNGGYETVMVEKGSKRGYENVSFAEKSGENMSPIEQSDPLNPP